MVSARKSVWSQTWFYPPPFPQSSLSILSPLFLSLLLCLVSLGLFAQVKSNAFEKYFSQPPSGVIRPGESTQITGRLHASHTLMHPHPHPNPNPNTLIWSVPERSEVLTIFCRSQQAAWTISEIFGDFRGISVGHWPKQEVRKVECLYYTFVDLSSWETHHNWIVQRSISIMMTTIKHYNNENFL